MGGTLMAQSSPPDPLARILSGRREGHPAAFSPESLERPAVPMRQEGAGFDVPKGGLPEPLPPPPASSASAPPPAFSPSPFP